MFVLARLGGTASLRSSPLMGPSRGRISTRSSRARPWAACRGCEWAWCRLSARANGIPSASSSTRTISRCPVRRHALAQCKRRRALKGDGLETRVSKRRRVSTATWTAALDGARSTGRSRRDGETGPMRRVR
ncbi:hypothetical protein M885DRAFT_133416 [Pelagophyceae sp. CCMP2097]|nr:hypothetical protein M885DRAFT_133416 [Pelagophyceae sp. CCMP2097]